MLGVKNEEVVGAAVANGLICLRLMKFGTSDADERGIGPGDKVGFRDGRADDRAEGGSGKMVSGDGDAPDGQLSCRPYATHQCHKGQ